jgi:LacI family gluconate utilization system Gnt-I transcriptional repressor
VVPALTTIRVRRYEIGQRAGRLICERLSRRAVRRRRIDTGYELIVRDSA